MKGFRYQGIIGEGKTLDLNGGFVIDIPKLNKMLADLV